MKTTLGVFLVLFLSAVAFGQAVGTINGRVTDQAGAVLPGATVTATNVGTSVSRTTATNEEGLYSFPSLQPGTYDVKVELSGFAATTKRLTLVASSTLTTDFSMGVAAVAQEVQVSGEAPLVETTQSDVSNTLRVGEIQSLPMLNRNFVGMVTLVPGARMAQNVNSNKIGFGGAIAVGGGTGRNVELLVDGVSTRDDVVGGTMFNFTLEGIQEFKVFAHDFGAQFGRTSGSVVVVASKSGTNELHGSAFAFGRNDSMTATDYFADPKNNGLGKPPYEREQFGGSLGGPIKKDKLFVFGAIERVQEDRSKVYPATAYNEAVILKQALTSLTTCPTCMEVGNALQPTPVSPQTIRDLQYTVKGDYQANDHHSLFVRWAQQRLDSFNDLIVNNNAPPHPDMDPTGSNVYDTGRGYSIVGSHTWVIGNNSVNNFSVQGNHLLTSQICKCGTPGPYWASRNLQFGASFQVGVSQNSTDQDFYQTTVQFRDNFSHQIGKHALKLGGDFAFYPRVGVALAGAGGISQGATAFFDVPSVILSNKTKYPQGFLTPGAVSSITVGDIMLGGSAGRTDTQGQKQFGAYIQDDWKVTPRLTLNLGLNYNLDINWYNQREYANNRTYQALKAIGSSYGALPKTPTTDLAPRVGLAWDVTGNGKNVLRAGFGIFFDQILVISNFPSAIQEKATLANLAATFVNSNVGVGQLSNYVYGVSPLPAGPAPRLTKLRPGASSSGSWLSPKLTDPYNEQVHVGYTRQMTSTTAVSADFTHILGLHDFRVRQINPIESPLWDPNAASYNTCGATGTFRRLQCAFGSALGDPAILGGINLTTTDNRSQYDEFILHVENRHRIATFQASYTLSRAMGFGGAISGATGGIGATAAQNADQLFAPGEWGPTLTDERHRVVLTSVFTMPFGIEAAPIFQYGSARPYNLTMGRDLNAAEAAAGYCCAGDGVADRYIDPATGKQVGINAGRGTATYTLDSRFSKYFRIGETRRLNFFAELYNITNKANFGNSYNGNALSPTFRQPTNYLNNGLSLPTSRQLQLGARFTF